MPPPIRAEAVFRSHQPYRFSDQSKPIGKPATTLQSSRPTVRAEAEAGPSRPWPVGTSRTSRLAEAELERSRPSRLVEAEAAAKAGPHRSARPSRPQRQSAKVPTNQSSDTEDEDYRPIQVGTEAGSSPLARLPLVFNLTPGQFLEKPFEEEEETAEQRKARIYRETWEKACATTRAARDIAPPVVDFEPLVVKPYGSISDPLSGSPFRQLIRLKTYMS